MHGLENAISGDLEGVFSLNFPVHAAPSLKVALRVGSKCPIRDIWRNMCSVALSGAPEEKPRSLWV